MRAKYFLLVQALLLLVGYALYGPLVNQSLIAKSVPTETPVAYPLDRALRAGAQLKSIALDACVAEADYGQFKLGVAKADNDEDRSKASMMMDYKRAELGIYNEYYKRIWEIYDVTSTNSLQNGLIKPESLPDVEPDLVSMMLRVCDR